MSGLLETLQSSKAETSPVTYGGPEATQRVEQFSFEELLSIVSQDMAFYGQYFFPRAMRQQSPQFHLDMFSDVIDPTADFVAWEIFRGGAKTTITRIVASYLIALGFSRTICVVGKSEAHAISTVEWLLKAAKFNALWANTFKIGVGGREAQNHIELIHGIEQVPVRVVGLGMQGSLRGINFEDYRPDLILVDDPCDDENTSTPQARAKTSGLFFGDLKQSLAPRSEAPMRKMILSQTVLNREDLISTCVAAPEWRSRVYSCFDSGGESRWAERWSTADLLADKATYIQKNKLSIWLREMECKIVSDETSAFPWPLQYWTVVPEGGITIIAVDPTPPPREGEVAKAARKAGKLDKAAVVALRLFRNAIFILEVKTTTSPDEEELFTAIEELCIRWGPVMHVAIETILFARVIASGFRKWMARKRRWMTVKQVEDRRAKATRITSEISHFASNFLFFCHPSQKELVEQYTEYPDVNHEDVLDAVSIGLMSLGTWNADEKGLVMEGEYERLEPREVQMRCP